MPKGYWKASGQFLKGIGKPPIGKNVAISMFLSSSSSSELLRFCLHTLKVEEAVENVKNAQWFLFATQPRKM
jgi:hypothetical protein